ncbi:MAG: hypothetical protein K0R72_641 [Clostridia bacterium]|jgi:uncharacterized membrane protein|nr:hypothetical protein [Clostridia bacterium]
MINKGLYFFIIGSFIGWILEIVFKIISKEEVVRAGMANGPFCILYGMGTFVLAMIISKYTKNVFLIFIFSSIILTSLEYATGLLLDKVYEVELWDYSKLKFGINKYISFEFMLIWGVLGVIFINYILPNLNKIYIYLDGPILITMIYIVAIYILIDYIYTSIRILSMK